MPELTDNLRLKKPLLTEAADITVINENMDRIDEEVAQTQTDLLEHEEAALAHGAVSAATPNKIILRDSAGRAQVTAPYLDGDIVNKAYADGKIGGNDYKRSPGYAITTGSSAVYQVTLTPTPTAYVDGMRITIVPHAESGAGPKLNVNGLGEKFLKNKEDELLQAGDLKVNMPYEFLYRNGNFILLGEGGEKVTLVRGSKSGNNTESFSISGLAEYFDGVPQYIFINQTSGEESYIAANVYTVINSAGNSQYFCGYSAISNNSYYVLRPTVTYLNGTLTITTSLTSSYQGFKGSYTYLLFQYK